MNREREIELLALVASGTLPTGEVIRRTGRSPNTVIRYLRELEASGWIERRTASRFGRGRPPVVNLVSEAGLQHLRQGELALFRRLQRSASVAWGPVRAFSFWGIPFFRWSDLFADRVVLAKPFDLVVERNAELYADALDGPDGRYPCAEALIAWAAKSGDPRFAAAAAVLLKDARIDVARLVRKSARMRTENRVGFLAAAVRARSVLRAMEPKARREAMLRGSGPVDAATAALAERWNVRNPVALRAIAEMEELYGRTP